MKAKLLKWKSGNCLSGKKGININDILNDDFTYKEEETREIISDPAIPSKKPLPLKRANASYNLYKKVNKYIFILINYIL